MIPRTMCGFELRRNGFSKPGWNWRRWQRIGRGAGSPGLQVQSAPGQALQGARLYLRLLAKGVERKSVHHMRTSLLGRVGCSPRQGHRRRGDRYLAKVGHRAACRPFLALPVRCLAQWARPRLLLLHPGSEQQVCRMLKLRRRVKVAEHHHKLARTPGPCLFAGQTLPPSLGPRLIL